ncbi:MAG: hypothetical protein MJY67_06025 [Bacteroidales bacterium]|nr:hypothetical protein [Bacteroidales bacterium]
MKKSMSSTWIVIVAVAAVALVAGFFGVKCFSASADPDDAVCRPKHKPAGAALTMVQLRSINAMYPAGTHTYTVEFPEGAPATISVHCGHWHQDESYTEEIPDSVAAKVKEMIANSEVLKWDGFDGVNRHVLDGGGFSFAATWSDGTSVTAHGSNKYPEGYGYVADIMHELFRPYEKKFEYERVPKTLESDQITILFATFKQSGASGYSEYEFELREEPIGAAKNVVAKLFDYTGEFLKEPTLRPSDRLYVYAEAKNPSLSAVAKVIRKYELFKINGYDQTAENYNDMEWFQISALYDSGERVNLMGTEPFENYTEFRHDFIAASLSVVASHDPALASKLK